MLQKKRFSSHDVDIMCYAKCGRKGVVFHEALPEGHLYCRTCYYARRREDREGKLTLPYSAEVLEHRMGQSALHQICLNRHMSFSERLDALDNVSDSQRKDIIKYLNSPTEIKYKRKYNGRKT